MTLRSKATHLFTLRISTMVDTPMIIIEAHDGGAHGRHHQRVNVEVRQNGVVVFPLGQLYCGIPFHRECHSAYARYTCLTLVGMKPGDTCEEYFADYSPEQLAWASRHGEHLSIVALARYGEL